MVSYDKIGIKNISIITILGGFGCSVVISFVDVEISFAANPLFGGGAAFSSD